MVSMSSDRMNFSSCFANKIVDGPRLPFATRTAFVRGPEGHITKALGDLWARTLFLLFIRSSKRNALPLLPNFSALLPSIYRDFRWVGGPTLKLSWFLHRHLDSYIVTQNSRLSPGLVRSIQFIVTRQLPSTYRSR